MPLRPARRDVQEKLRKRLTAWYHRSKRDLPWRKTRDPYRILVSEIMLQQTQVATVISYYRRFIKTFPTAASLARAPLQKVLKLWEGLGYYRRARNLHRAARAIHEQWNDRVPSAVERLSSLPGVGRYTAGAVASIAFDVKAPVLDGNVRRVLCRIFAIRKDPRQAAVQDRLWELAAELLPDRNVGDFNQALMELGATVCLPRTPSCPVCPVRESCRARRSGLQDRIPVRTERRAVPHDKIAVALIQNRRGLLIGPRPEQGLLPGLWSFPEIEASEAATTRRIEREIEKRFGLKPKLLRPLDPVAHTFSHKRITYHPFLFNGDAAFEQPPEPWRWIPAEKIKTYPLPTATRKIFDQIAVNPQIAKRATPLPLAAERATVYRKTPK
ncbi:MAG TPA: A/G-specific adenine glycosylase [Nitrospiria bacterium]|nr:A/G-specific adenine glycosylase [Nitrospiria bacterium]